MEFRISTNSLQRAIKVLGVVVRANALDATGRVLIEAKDGRVVFMSNNGSTALTFTADDVEITEEGIVAVTYTKIKSFVTSYRAWDDESGAKFFNISADDKTTIMMVDNVFENGKSSKGKLTLSNFNPALITRPPEFEEETFSLNSTIFRAASAKVMYAINPQVDFNQPALQGMNIQFEDDSIFFAGSDGVVLSEYQVKNVSGNIGENITLQYDFIMGLRRLLTDDIDLLWEIKGNRVSIKFNEMVYTGRRIIGHEFPKYKPALDDYIDHINLNKDFLMSSLYPFSDVLDPDDNFRITLEIKDKELKIFNNQATIEAQLDNIVGGLDYSVDLNGKHLIQTVEAIKDDNVIFKFGGDQDFAIFDSSHYEDQKALISSIRKR
jgi:DNA polymerase III sliding clamp (beta) subunit (PCNA family)